LIQNRYDSISPVLQWGEVAFDIDVYIYRGVGHWIARIDLHLLETKDFPVNRALKDAILVGLLGLKVSTEMAESLVSKSFSLANS
jgi:hypothetical protein